MARILLFSQGVFGIAVAFALALPTVAAGQDSGEQLFIPSMEDSANESVGPVFKKKEFSSNSLVKSGHAERAAESSRTPNATASYRKKTPSAAEMSVGTFPGWTWALVALGGMAALAVPLCVILRRMRRPSRVGLTLISEESPRRHARAASQSLLAASLVQTQKKSEEFAEALYVKGQKSRRAA